MIVAPLPRIHKEPRVVRLLLLAESERGNLVVLAGHTMPREPITAASLEELGSLGSPIIIENVTLEGGPPSSSYRNRLQVFTGTIK